MSAESKALKYLLEVLKKKVAERERLPSTSVPKE